MLQKKKKYEEKMKAPHVGNYAESTENPLPPQGFLLHPFTRPAVGT